MTESRDKKFSFYLNFNEIIINKINSISVIYKKLDD